MHPSHRLLAISLAAIAWVSGALAAHAQAADPDDFELAGVVLNSATGAPVGGALVQLNLNEQRIQFSDANGAFAFTKLPRGRYFVLAKKPGYFNDQELGHFNGFRNSSFEVPSPAKATLKLTPEAVLYGEVKNEDGDPLEEVSVRVQRWQVIDGRKQLENVGYTVTDDEGSFRIPELKSGSYRLAFLESNREAVVTVDSLRAKKPAQQGYGSQFYPGVPDAESATAIELHAGAQVRVTQNLLRQQLFDVAGTIHGGNPEAGFAITLSDTDGESPQKNVRIDPRSGAFLISGIPAGTYVLTVIGQLPSQNAASETTPPPTATEVLRVRSDLSGVNLVLGRGVSVNVQVTSPPAAEGANSVPQVLVRMFAKEFPQLSLATIAPPQAGEKRSIARIDSIPPGIYTVEVAANQPGYVASVRCGTLDLLREELPVSPGATPPPIEVTLRNDGAQLNVKVTDHGQPAAAGVIVYSEEFPRRSFLLRANESGAVGQANIAPGRYRVVALEDVQDMEFRDPVAMQKYLEHATEVTLQPGDQVSITTELQKSGEPQQ